VLHTSLAKSYIDHLFQLCPPSTDVNSDLMKSYIEQKKDPAFTLTYDKLKQFIESPKARYNSGILLDYRVRDSWMLINTITLYGRERRHDEALTKLIDMEQYAWAEKHCCDYNDNLLTKLFRKYIDIYNRL
jgi:hypothetical protein